jgi:hypothetical protein
LIWQGKKDAALLAGTFPSLKEGISQEEKFYFFAQEQLVD